MDHLFCLICKQVFIDTKNTRHRQNVLTLGEFFVNQRNIIFNNKQKYFKTKKKETFIINCPHCRSKHNININDILEVVTGVGHGGNRNSRHFRQYDFLKKHLKEKTLNMMRDKVIGGDRQ